MMDNLTESIGQLSTEAREWRPGMGFERTTTSTTNATAATSTTSITAGTVRTATTTGVRSLSTESSPWTPNRAISSSSSISTAHMTPQDSNASASASASGINVNASNWVPQSRQTQHSSIMEQQQQQQQSLEQMNVEDTNNNINNGLQSPSTCSVPTGPIPSPHQQTFKTNNPVSLPLSKTLISENIHTGSGGSGGTGTSTSNNGSNTLPNHLLSKLYRQFHVDCTNQMSPNDERYKAIPQSFVNAMPLENIKTTSNTTSNNNVPGGSNTNQVAMSSPTDIRSSFGYPSSVFKVTNVDDGRLYCLRRFDNVKCVNGKIASHVSNMWNHAVRKKTQAQQQEEQQQQQQHRHRLQQQQQHVLNHPGIVRFYKAFYINQNRALFFIHEYYPNALTLREALFGLKRGESGKLNMNNSMRSFHPLNESVIWSYVTQLVTAIKSVHLGGLAVRVLQLNHILVTHDLGSGFLNDSSGGGFGAIGANGGNLMTNRVRLRINCIGIVDALEFESRKEVEECQKEDMRCLGRLILSLATGVEIRCDVDEDTLNKCDAYMSQTYSPELYNLTNALLSRKRMGRLGHLLEVDPPNIQNVCRIVGEHALDELDSVHVTVDKMDEALASEYESGRGLRLLLKLGFVNERPEFGVDTRWSESGDCYVLKLFRDYGKFHRFTI